MPVYTNNAAAILRPEQVGDLLVTPTIAAAVATKAATVVHTTSNAFRLPTITADPSAAWVAEGAEIPVSDAAFGEVEVIPSKVAGLVILSREAADDTSPAAATAVGQALARDIARRLDEAFCGNISGGVAPKGLASLTAAGGLQTVAQPATWANLDAFADAAALVEQQGATVTHWLANPADALALAKVKTTTGAAAPLLAADPTAAAQRTVEGRPLLISPAVAAGKLYGLDASRTYVVVRADATVDVDRSAYFTSDRVAVRATMRVGVGFAHPGSVVRITVASS